MGASLAQRQIGGEASATPGRHSAKAVSLALQRRAALLRGCFGMQLA